MSKKKIRFVAWLMCILMLFGITGCQNKDYEKFRLQPNEYLMGESGSTEYTETEEPDTEHPGSENTEIEEPDTEADGNDGYESGTQLTEEDIQYINGGNARFVYSEEGYLTFLDGKFYDKPIIYAEAGSDELTVDYERGVESLQGVASLIGLAKGSEFFCVYGSTDSNGYSYLTYRQRYGDSTVLYGTLKIIIDPEGYVAGLSSSFVPNIGIAPESGEGITAEQAENIVMDMWEEDGVNLYSEYTRKVAITIDQVTYYAWAVYTSNPSVANSNNDQVYLEHLLRYDNGSYLQILPVSSVEERSGDEAQTEKALSFFDNMEPATYTGKVTLNDGTQREITVPVARSKEDGLYYLADLERHILVADYYAYDYQNTLSAKISENNADWEDNDLLALDSYICAYDFYESHDLTSVDDFGTPLLILTNYCNSEGEVINNACSCGMIDGWSVFATAGIYCQGVDIQAHEFTHAVTGYSSGGNYYQNESGAVNEAYSDIMGNLCEMSMGRTTDKEWLVGETTGRVMRSMSNPVSYEQPEYVGDMYYFPETDATNPYVSENNDRGGVHFNNSLIAHIAYELDKAGMTYDEQYSLWMISQEMLTSKSGFDEVYAALLLSCRTNGFDVKYSEVITKAFEEANIFCDRDVDFVNATRSGCGRVVVNVSPEIVSSVIFIGAKDPATGELAYMSSASKTGIGTMLLPAGEYFIVFYICTSDNKVVEYSYSSSETWESGDMSVLKKRIVIQDGDVVTLNDLN